MKDKIDYKKSWKKLKECIKEENRENKILMKLARKEYDFIEGLEKKIDLSYGEWIIDEINELERIGKLL